MQAARMGLGNFNGKQNKSELLHQPATPHTLKDSGATEPNDFLLHVKHCWEATTSLKSGKTLLENPAYVLLYLVLAQSLTRNVQDLLSLFFSFPFFFPLFLSFLSLPPSLSFFNL